jgi:hypothetical protein
MSCLSIYLPIYYKLCYVPCFAVPASPCSCFLVQKNDADVFVFVFVFVCLARDVGPLTSCTPEGGPFDFDSQKSFQTAACGQVGGAAADEQKESLLSWRRPPTTNRDRLSVA